jgi:hypothetical protein
VEIELSGDLGKNTALIWREIIFEHCAKWINKQGKDMSKVNKRVQLGGRSRDERGGFVCGIDWPCSWKYNKMYFKVLYEIKTESKCPAQKPFEMF